MKPFKKCVVLILLSIILGVICGGCGAVFCKTITLVTNIRIVNSWLLYMLPIGGLALIIVYKICNVGNIGTTNVFDCIKTQQNLPFGLPFAIFCGTCLSHLFGASVGREGAALQIGGGIANIFSRLLKLNDDICHILIMCGMAGLFSAVFGTPLAASIFVLEVIMTRICFFAAVPVLFSSISAFVIAKLLHIHPERFNIGVLPTFSFSAIWKTTAITVASVLVAFVFCKGLHFGKVLAKKLLKNKFLRIAIGGIVIIALTLLVNSHDYNGSGIDIIERTFSGSVIFGAFALKMLFTIICISCGYKGGEIIPTFFIGATLGGALAMILNIPISIGAAVGMAVLFVCVTKCPLATIFICCEMFGFACAPLIIPVVILSFSLARFNGIYNNKDSFNYLLHIKKDTVF